MATIAIPTLDVLRDLPIRVELPDALRADVVRCTNAVEAAATDDARRASLDDVERVTTSAIGWIDGEIAQMVRLRFATDDAEALRSRLVTEPRRRAEAIVASLQQHVASDRAEWSRRVEKQTRDVLEAMRATLAKLELDVPPATIASRVAVRRGFRERFTSFGDAAMDAWASHLTTLLDSRYEELVRDDLDALESVLGVVLEATPPGADIPSCRVRIPDALYEADVEVLSLAAAVFGPFKGGLDVVALLAGLLVVPLVGRFMDESPILLRVSVVGAMILAALLVAVASGLRSRQRAFSAALASARVEIVRAVDASFTAQVERFRLDVERRCGLAIREGLRATLRSLEPAIARFVREREAATVAALAAAQLDLDRLGDRLRSLRGLRTSLDEGVLVDVRRARGRR